MRYPQRVLRARSTGTNSARRVIFIGQRTVILALLLAGAIAGRSWSFGLEIAPTLSLALPIVTTLLLDAG